MNKTMYQNPSIEDFYFGSVEGRFGGKQHNLNGKTCRAMIRNSRLVVMFENGGSLRTSPVEQIRAMGHVFSFKTASGSTYQVYA